MSTLNEVANMLIEFQVENFRSLKGRQTFSMVGAALTEHVNTNTFDSGLKGFDRLLRSAVIYGANAAGKTNMLRAIHFMKTFVLNSASETTAPNPYSPFKLSKATTKAPSEFQITFVQGGTRYEYGFTLGPTRIEHEWLTEHVQSRSRTRARAMFDRVWDSRSKKHTWTYGPYFKGQKSTWSEATRDEALFLSTATQLNSTQLRPVFDWFQKKLVVIVGEINFNQSLSLKLWDQPEGKENLLSFLKEADIGIVDINIEKQPVPSGALVMVGEPMLERKKGSQAATIAKVVLSHMSDDPKSPVQFDFEEESSGTKILFKSAGAWLNVINNGEVLLYDEIDTNMHPKLLGFLIQKFHSDVTNPNNAQLICTTHNTSLQSRDFFRRDQIWFVEKERNGASKLYPLTDFRPRGDEAIERGYLRGRYGATPVLPDVSS